MAGQHTVTRNAGRSMGHVRPSAREIITGGGNLYRTGLKIIDEAKKWKRGGNKPGPNQRRVVKRKNVGDVGSGHSTFNSHQIVLNESVKHRKGEKNLGFYRYEQAYGGYISGLAGLQTYTSIQTIGTPAQLCQSSTIGTSVTTNHTSILNMNPYLSNTGSAIMSTTTIPLESKFVVSEVDLNLEMTNMSAVGTLIDVYIVKAKKTGGTLMECLTCWNNTYANEAFGQPQGSAPSAVNGTAGTVGYQNQSFVGNLPNQAKLFSENWKIEAVKSVKLTAASTENIKINFKLNKVISKDIQAQYLADANVYIKGQTYHVFTVSRGMIVNDTTLLATSGEIPTYGQHKVGYILTQKWKAHAVQGNNNMVLNTNRVYNQIPYGASTANQSFMNEVDVPTTVQTATNA